MQLRIKRLSGLTMLALAFKDTPNKEPIYSHILSHYIQNGFTYLGIRYTIPELSNLLSIPEDTVMRAINNGMGIYSRMLKPDSIEDTLRALLSGSLTEAFRGTEKAEDLVTKLQGQLTYTPAKTGVPKVDLKVGYLYTKALEVWLKSQSNSFAIISSLMPKGGQNTFILNQQGPQGGEADKGLITREEALELISRDANPLMLAEGPNGQKAIDLYARHNLAETPEVMVGASGDLGAATSQYLLEPTEEIIAEIVNEDGELRD